MMYTLSVQHLYLKYNVLRITQKRKKTNQIWVCTIHISRSKTLSFLCRLECSIFQIETWQIWSIPIQIWSIPIQIWSIAIHVDTAWDTVTARACRLWKPSKLSSFLADVAPLLRTRLQSGCSKGEKTSNTLKTHACICMSALLIESFSYHTMPLFVCKICGRANYTGGPTTCTQCDGLVLKSKICGIVVLQLINMWRFGPQSIKRWHMAL
jgi:hypothetical protein